MALKWVFRGFEALENVQDVVERTNGSTQCAERTKYDLVVALRNWQGAVRHKSLKPFLFFVYDRKNTKKKLADAFITNVLAEAAKQGKLELEFEQVDIDGDDSETSKYEVRWEDHDEIVEAHSWLGKLTITETERMKRGPLSWNVTREECRSGEASWRTYSGKGMLIYSREDVLNIMLECRDGIKHAIATFTKMAEKHTAGETLQAVEQALLLRDAELVNALKTLHVTNVQVQIMSLFSALAMLGNISRVKELVNRVAGMSDPHTFGRLLGAAVQVIDCSTLQAAWQSFVESAGDPSAQVAALQGLSAAPCAVPALGEQIASEVISVVKEAPVQAFVDMLEVATTLQSEKLVVDCMRCRPLWPEICTSNRPVQGCNAVLCGRIKRIFCKAVNVIGDARFVQALRPWLRFIASQGHPRETLELCSALRGDLPAPLEPDLSECVATACSTNLAQGNLEFWIKIFSFLWQSIWAVKVIHQASASCQTSVQPSQSACKTAGLCLSLAPLC